MPETNPDPTNDTIKITNQRPATSTTTTKAEPPAASPTTNQQPVASPTNQQPATSPTPVASQTTAGKKEESVMNYLEKIYMYLFLGYIIKDGKMEDNVIFRMFNGKVGRAFYLMILYRIMIVISGFFITMFLQNERGTFIYLVIASWVAYLSYSFILVDTYP